MQCTYGICDECQNSDNCVGEFIPILDEDRANGN